jgi:predicted ribosome quality control (RQC) complex YloA/Tae2 family protein
MKTDMSSFDIMAMVSELQRDMRLKKVFQPSPAELRVQVRFIEGGTKNILVEVGKKMYLSDYSPPSPKFPSNFAMTLRKHLTNAVVKEISQVGFDRIVELTAQCKEGDFKLIFELFGEGNVILTDSEGVIKAVMKRRRFKHRELVGKEVYSYPPQRKNPFESNPENLAETVEGYGSLVKALAVPLGLGGLYSEEVCIRSGIKKDAIKIVAKEAETLTRVLNELKKEALTPKPVLVLEDDEPIDVTPMRLQVYRGKKMKEFSTFNAALDEFFTRGVVERIEEKAEEGYKDGLVTTNLRLREQAKAIGRFTREIRDYKLIGDGIYENFDKIQTLIDAVARARKTVSAGEIKSKLKDVEVVKQYLSKENALIVSLGGFEFKIDLSIAASKNADAYYTRSKKAKDKLKGARSAAQETKERIKEYVRGGREKSVLKTELTEKKYQKKIRWFERFRWFKSSEGFLVIGGRDSTSNETIVKRHMEKGDLFIHADIHGAPAIVVKAEGREVPEKTVDEACQFAASNSAAWKSNAAFLEVYWVNPDQVSKTPKSGEYVAKGAFIIRGKRNFRRSKIALSIGVKVDDEAEVMCGPLDAMRTNCDYQVSIVPGRLKSKEAALKVKEILLADSSEEHEGPIKRLNIDEIQRVLPTGGYSIIGRKGRKR